MTEDISEPVTNVFESLDLPYHAKAMEVLSKFHGMALTPSVTKELLSAISTALEEAVKERDAFIQRLQHEMSYLVKKHMEEPLICGICGKKQDEVKKMIAGKFAQICDECALTAADIIVTETDNTISNRLKPR